MALQAALRSLPEGKIEAHTTEMTVLQEQLVAKSSKLLQLSAEHVGLTNELRQIVLQCAAG